MDLAGQLTAHLHALTGQADGDAVSLVTDITDGLTALAEDLAAEVPSFLSVSIVLTQPFGDVTVTVPVPTLPVPTRVADAATVVQASLAIPLDTAAGGAVLLLQAADPGAFVLLADDLMVQRDPHGLPLLLDQHLVLLPDPDGGRLTAELADCRVLEQAVGAMIDQSWLPAQARQELRDRAQNAQNAAPSVARQLLAGLAGLPGPDAPADP